MGELPNNYVPLRKLLFVGWVFSAFDLLVKYKGWQTALLTLITITASGFTVKTDEDTEKMLKTAPLIIVTEHPPIPVMVSLPKRSDIFLITASEFMGSGTYTQKHLIPVFLEDEYEHANLQFVVKIVRFLNITPHVSKEEARTRNIQSIQIASEKVAQGGIVVITPEGIHGRGGSWYPGIARLLKEIKQKNAYYVKAFVATNTRLGLLSHIPILRKMILVRYRVFFSKPQKIDEITSEDIDPYILTQSLEHEYKKWVSSLTE